MNAELNRDTAVPAEHYKSQSLSPRFVTNRQRLGLAVATTPGNAERHEVDEGLVACLRIYTTRMHFPSQLVLPPQLRATAVFVVQITDTVLSLFLLPPLPCFS